MPKCSWRIKLLNSCPFVFTENVSTRRCSNNGNIYIPVVFWDKNQKCQHLKFVSLINSYYFVHLIDNNFVISDLGIDIWVEDLIVCQWSMIELTTARVLPWATVNSSTAIQDDKSDCSTTPVVDKHYWHALGPLSSRSILTQPTPIRIYSLQKCEQYLSCNTFKVRLFGL